MDGARDFFDRDDTTKKEFEKWAVSLIGFQPQAKKGADGGVDGMEWFGPGKAHRAIVSVKGGKSVTVVDACSTPSTPCAKAQGAEIAVLLSLEPPTKGAVDWAKAGGPLRRSPAPPSRSPRLQLVTHRGRPEARPRRGRKLPLRHADTFKKAPKEAARPAAGDLFG